MWEEDVILRDKRKIKYNKPRNLDVNAPRGWNSRGYECINDYEYVSYRMKTFD
jgi:hypothetical protein